MSASEPKPGEILAGTLKVQSVLGRGSMGVVVSVVHTELKHRRAVKLMLESAAASPQAVERFLREARMVAKLESQHVVRVYDMGRLETGAPYIVMEQLEGTDLKSVLEGRGRLPPAEAVAYLLQACDALAEAHGAHIVHRDLKPSNLFLATTPRGPVIKLIDFGIAKSLQEEQMEMTGTSQLLGTPLYMSPEQMRSTKNVDLRTDIWALGVILYRMLTGRTPFSGSTVPEICMSVIGDQPDAPSAIAPDVPKALDAVVARCLEKNPARRFPDVAAFVAALKASLDAPAAVEAPVHSPARHGLGTLALDPRASVAASSPQALVAERSGSRPALAGTAVMNLAAPHAAQVAMAPAAQAPRAPFASQPDGTQAMVVVAASPADPAPAVPTPAAPAPPAPAAWAPAPTAATTGSSPAITAPILATPSASTPAPRRSSVAGPLAASALVLGLAGGGALYAFGGRAASAPEARAAAPTSTSVSPGSAGARDVAPAPTASSTPAPPTSAEPAPSAAPGKTVATAPKADRPGPAPPLGPPTARPTAKATAGPPRARPDAFGNDRK